MSVCSLVSEARTMRLQEQSYTVEEFEAFVEREENADKLFEYIGGEIVEVPSNPYVSKIAMMIGAMILAFVQKHKLGHVTGEAGGYQVGGGRYAPDVGFISYEKQPELAAAGYNPNPPDLAVEVVSAGNTQELDRLRLKITNYLAVGTVVWVVKPGEKYVEVHNTNGVTIFREQDTLTGGDVLPGLEIKVAEIFN